MEEEMIRRMTGIIVKEIVLTTLKTLVIPAAIGFTAYKAASHFFGSTNKGT